MVGLPWSQHVAFLDDRALKRAHPPRDHRAGRRARRSSGGADVRARQRDSARRRALARSDARRAFPAQPVRGRQGRVARQPVHLRQLSADRISRSLVPRHLRLQRLPASRARAARVSRAAAAHRRPEAAAARRGGRRQHPRRRSAARPRSRRCTSAPRSRKARAARSRSRGPTSGGAAAIRSTTGSSAWSIASAGRSRRRPPSPRRSTTRRSRASASAAWPRVSVVVCAYNAADTLEDNLRSLEQLTYPDYEIILVNDGSKDRTGEIGHRFARVRVDRHPERRPERGAQRRAGGSDRRDRRLHRRRHARRSRLADVPRPAVPDLGRRRLRRTERRAARRSADRAVHRARAGRADARAARRSHRRARARLQHGVPPRRAAGDRRLQSDLPPRRRRCGRVLAAAGARLEDRLRVVGARLAPPPLVGAGLLAAAGRLRRGRDLADGASSGEIPRRPHAVARPHLQPAAVRALAVGHARSTPASGAPPRFRRSIAPTCTRSRSCRTRSAGR